MRKYISDPNVLLAGSAFLSILVASKLEEFKGDFYATLAEYGVTEINPDGWYPRQMYLDFFKQIASRKSNVLANMISAGIKVIDTVQLPSDLNLDSMKDIFELLNKIYQLNQRNLPPEDTGYEIKQVTAHHIRIIDHTPYPHDVLYGYLYGLIHRFCPPTTALERTFLNLSNPDYDGAVYDITWE